MWLQPCCPSVLPVCSWGAPRLCFGAEDEGGAQEGGRRGRQLQRKEQISLSNLMLCICVSVGAGALARSVALLFSLPVAVPDCHICAHVGSCFINPAATNVMWTLQLRCQDSSQGFGFLVPTPRLGRNLRPGKPWPQVGLDGHLWAWMGTLAKPSFGGRGQSWVCSGSLLDLGCHLAAWASRSWVGAQGKGHHGDCDQNPVLVTDWDGKTSGSQSAMGRGLSPCICRPAPPHPAPDVNGLLQIESSHLNP